MKPGIFEETPHCITLSDESLLDLRNPSVDSIRIQDIASSLSNVCRFNGHIEKFYSVAEHSVCVAHDALHRGCSIPECLAALMHDATEAYIGDMSRPLKDILGSQIDVIERGIEKAIGEAFEIDFEATRESVDVSDNAITLKEFQLFRPDCADLLTPSFDQVLKGYRTQWPGPKFLPPARASNLFWHSYDFLKMQLDA